MKNVYGQKDMKNCIIKKHLAKRTDKAEYEDEEANVIFETGVK